MVAYDPAFAYEIAVILQSGIERMYRDGEDVVFYLTVGNETYGMPPKPAGCEEGVLKGINPKRPDPFAQDTGGGAGAC